MFEDTWCHSDVFLHLGQKRNWSGELADNASEPERVAGEIDDFTKLQKLRVYIRKQYHTDFSLTMNIVFMILLERQERWRRMYYPYAQQMPRRHRRVMTVTGIGNISVAPDTVQIQLEVRTENRQLSQAQQENAH